MISVGWMANLLAGSAGTLSLRMTSIATLALKSLDGCFSLVMRISSWSRMLGNWSQFLRPSWPDRLILCVTLQQKILLDQGDEAGKLDREVSALVSVNIGKD